MRCTSKLRSSLSIDSYFRHNPLSIESTFNDKAPQLAFLTVLLLTFFLAALNGCGGSGFAKAPDRQLNEAAPDNALLEGPGEGVAEENGGGLTSGYALQFIHAAVDEAPMLVTSVGSQPFLLDYGQVSGGNDGTLLLDPDSGPVILSFPSVLKTANPNPHTQSVPVPLLNASDNEVEPGWVVAAKSLSGQTVEPFLIRKDITPADANQVTIQLFHAAVGQQGQPLTLDAYLVAENDSVAQHIAAGLAVNETLIEYAVPVNLGSVEAQRRRFVLVDRATQNIVFESVLIEWSLFRGQTVLVVILDSVTVAESSKSPFKLMIASNGETVSVADRATGSALQVLHASPDAASLEVFLGRRGDTLPPQVLVPSFDYLDAFPNVSNYLQVGAGQYDFFVAPDTDQVGDTVAGLDAQQLKVGSDYRVVVSGRSLVNSPALKVVLEEHKVRPLGGVASVDFVNLVANVGGVVDVFLAPEGRYALGELLAGVDDVSVLSVEGLNYSQTSEVLQLEAPAIYNLHVVSSEGSIYSATISVAEHSISTLMVVEAKEDIGTIGGDLNVIALGDAQQAIQPTGNFVDAQGVLLLAVDVPMKLFPDTGLRFEQLVLLNNPRTITSVGVRTDWWRKRPTEVAVYEAVNGQKGRLIGYQQFPNYLNTICGINFDAPCSFPDVDGSATAELRVGVENIQTDRIIIEIDGLLSIANGSVNLKGFAVYGLGE